MVFKYNPVLPLRQFYRFCTTKQCSSGNNLLQEELKKLFAEHVNIPMVIGNEMIFSGDEQNLYMPHNHRRITAKYYYASKNHIKIAIKKAMDVKETWANTDIKTRSDILLETAAVLSKPEKKSQLMAAIMLSQAKTEEEAEVDVLRMIKMFKQHVDHVTRISELKFSTNSKNIENKFVLRPLDGFVLVSGPIYMTWYASSLAIQPLIMGNVVLWRPPINTVLPSFIIYKAIMNAGVPRGVFQFLPSNYTLFFNTGVNSNDLAGINYAGRVSTLRQLWYDVSSHLQNYKCFPRLVGDCDSKGYHFVHESGDVDLILECTVESAFRYSGQRSTSCARLYVPTSVWEELECPLLDLVDSLQIGDPLDPKSYASAVIRSEVYEEVVKKLEEAKSNANVKILCGGTYDKTHGYFIEPTVIQCNDPRDRLMIDDIMGPVLSVYVYDNKMLNEILEVVTCTQQFGTCGSIFSDDQQATDMLLQKLRMTTSNMYINEKCSGSEASHLPLSGNRLSGTNDKYNTPYDLLRFAAPQLIEIPVCEETEEDSSRMKKCV